MAGADEKPVKDVEVLDQLAEHRRRRDRRTHAVRSATPVASVGPGPDPMQPLDDDPYRLMSSLRFDEDSDDEQTTRVTSPADHTLDALEAFSEPVAEPETTQVDEPETTQVDDLDSEDEIGAALHRYHERAIQPTAAHAPRGSAELNTETVHKRPARAAGQHRANTAKSRGATTIKWLGGRSWRRGGAGTIVSIVVAVVVIVIAIVAITTNAPRHHTTSPRGNSVSAAHQATTHTTPPVVMALRPVFSDATTGAHQAAKIVIAARAARLRRGRAAKHRARLAHQRAQRVRQRKARLRREKAAAAAEQSSSSSSAASEPESTTPTESYTPTTSYTPPTTSYTPPATSSPSDTGSSSSSTGSSSGSSSSQPAGPTGVPTVTGCDPKCS